MILGFNVLTAAQTGNTVLLAVALAQEKLDVGPAAAVSVAAFVVGAAAAELALVVPIGALLVVAAAERAAR